MRNCAIGPAATAWKNIHIVSKLSTGSYYISNKLNILIWYLTHSQKRLFSLLSTRVVFSQNYFMYNHEVPWWSLHQIESEVLSFNFSLYAITFSQIFFAIFCFKTWILLSLLLLFFFNLSHLCLFLWRSFSRYASYFSVSSLCIFSIQSFTGVTF